MGKFPLAVAATICSSFASSSERKKMIVDDIEPPELLTMSIILPCAGEEEYAKKTVISAREATPAKVLKEIIIVDDGTNPPLEQDHITPEFQREYGVKLIRNPKTLGLIQAKQIGGDAATGDILVFYDCHVAPQKDYYVPYFVLLKQNWKRLVVPSITNLNIDTWTEMPRGHGPQMSRCYNTFDADFKWIDSDNDNAAPVISGGLFATTRQWWNITEGYDEKMEGWGGENVEQSMRTWLCGGDIISAPESYVAHMWRGPDPRTRAKYRSPPRSAMINRYRASQGWMGEYSVKMRDEFGFSNIEVGDLSNIRAVQEKLGCRDYTWFLHRFRDIYLDGGMVPDKLFMIKHKGLQKCLRYMNEVGTNYSGAGRGKTAWHDCDTNDDRQRWHTANRKIKGIRAWNTDQCLTFQGEGTIDTHVCIVPGTNSNQKYKLTGNELKGPGEKCFDENGKSIPCGSPKSKQWARMYADPSLESKIYQRHITENPELYVDANPPGYTPLKVAGRDDAEL